MQTNAGKEVKILKNLLPKHKCKTRPKQDDVIPFGKIATDHMLVCDFVHNRGGWQAPEITAYSSFELHPSAVALHYGQQIFEGMKAYLSPSNDGKIFLFRPEMNANRFFRSATRLGMEPVPVEMFLKSVEELVKVEREWILPSPGALYIRPCLIPMDDGVSYRASLNYRFFIILSPAKNYYAKDNSITVAIEREHVRAVPGGTGEAKCGGNYAGALPALAKAKKLGADQVMWLDYQHKYVEEVGAMNLMFVYKNKIITPKLNGSILPGVTRDSLLTLGKTLGLQMVEEQISIEQILKDTQSGELQEAFGCGTAAVITPIDTFMDGEKIYEIQNKNIGPTCLLLRKALVEIQNGTGNDPFGWRKTI